jgi:hypothetical protein
LLDNAVIALQLEPGDATGGRPRRSQPGLDGFPVGALEDADGLAFTELQKLR